MAELHIAQTRRRELFLDGGDRHHPVMGVMQVAAGFLRLNLARAL